MPHHAETLARLEAALAQDVRLSGAAAAPVHVFTVVDFYGEPMDCDPRFRTMPEWKSREFSVAFQKWLHEQSRKLRGASLNEAAEALRDSSEFRGQFLVFTSLSDFAAWFAEPAQNALDAYVTCYTDAGLPIFRVSPFMDGKRRKRGRK